MTTPRLTLPEIAESQAGKYIVHNEAIRVLDALVQPVALAIAATPASTAEGAVYIVSATPSGAFAGQANKVAARIGGAWRFIAPATGWRFTLATGGVVAFSGSAWAAEPRRVSVPATASSPGQVGEWATDADYYYTCTAPDTWKRAALTTW